MRKVARLCSSKGEGRPEPGKFGYANPVFCVEGVKKATKGWQPAAVVVAPSRYAFLLADLKFKLELPRTGQFGRVVVAFTHEFLFKMSHNQLVKTPELPTR